MSEISIIILTYNEERHIKRCIESLLPITSTIFVIDSFSNDKTVAISESLGAKVYQRPWKNYADQFQWGLDNCPINTEWVMRIDADEYLNESMQCGLPNSLKVASDETSGYICCLRNVFLGRTIHFGGYDPLKLLRIWRYQRGRIESRWMDEHIVLTNGCTERAPGEIIHNNLNNHRWWTDKHNKYADREMVDILFKKYQIIDWDNQIEKTDNVSAKVKRYLKESVYNNLPLFFRPTVYFLLRYVIFLGFLDGKEGFAYHYFQAYWYRSLVDVRVFEAEKLLENAVDNNERIMLLERLTGLTLR